MTEQIKSCNTCANATEQIKYNIVNGKEIIAEYDEDGIMEITRECFKKQIPRKPIPINWEKYKDKVINAEYMRNGFWCPNCKHIIKSGNYCVDCGQRIDWSDENDRED